MTDAAIFRASYHTDRDVPSRNVRQIVLEIPSEQTQDALRILGPRGSWVAVARLTDSQPEAAPLRPPGEAAPRPAGVREKPGNHQKWRDLPLVQRAAILCADKMFWKFMNADDASDCSEAMRTRCGVNSRTDLDTDTYAAERYRQIEREFFAHKEEQERFGP